jgi:hypothetical protein
MSGDFPRDSAGLRPPLVSRRRHQNFRRFLNDYRDFQADYVSRLDPINPDQRIGHRLLRGPRHPRPQPRLPVVVRVAPVPLRAVPPVPLLLAPLTAAHRLPRSHPHVGLEPPATDSTGTLACHSPSTSPARPAALTPRGPTTSPTPGPTGVGHFSLAEVGHFSRALQRIPGELALLVLLDLWFRYLQDSAESGLVPVRASCRWICRLPPALSSRATATEGLDGSVPVALPKSGSGTASHPAVCQRRYRRVGPARGAGQWRD